MFKSSFFFKKFYLYCLLILLLIYPLSFFSFTTFLNFKEPFFISPIAIKKELRIRCDAFGDGYFDARRSNGTRRHKGLDITAPLGAAVLASKSGIAEIGWVITGMGKYVKIKHAGGYSTLYGHLSKINVKNNRWVWQGDNIGEVGKTGNANHKRIEPHLHFEIRHKEEYLDPLKYLSAFAKGELHRR